LADQMSKISEAASAAAQQVKQRLREEGMEVVADMGKGKLPLIGSPSPIKRRRSSIRHASDQPPGHLVATSRRQSKAKQDSSQERSRSDAAPPPAPTAVSVHTPSQEAASDPGARKKGSPGLLPPPTKLHGTPSQSSTTRRKSSMSMGRTPPIARGAAARASRQHGVALNQTPLRRPHPTPAPVDVHRPPHVATTPPPFQDTPGRSGVPLPATPINLVDSPALPARDNVSHPNEPRLNPRSAPSTAGLASSPLSHQRRLSRLRGN